MKISIITLFPESLLPILNSSILMRAQKKQKVEFELINLRDFGIGKHQVVDGRPYGGGVGMVLRADILADALNSIQKTEDTLIILMSAAGTTFSQKIAREYSKKTHLIIICGHYEGIDARFIENYVDIEISIGDYVLTGGEIPALVLTDSIVRLIPGVLEKEEATLNESYENNLLEHDHYTRPEVFEDSQVPKVLLSGNHQEINKWRIEKSQERTTQKRPDLLK